MKTTETKKHQKTRKHTQPTDQIYEDLKQLVSFLPDPKTYRAKKPKKHYDWEPEVKSAEPWKD